MIDRAMQASPIALIPCAWPGSADSVSEMTVPAKEHCVMLPSWLAKRSVTCLIEFG